MKAKYLAISIGAVILLGSAWFGRAAWRAHHNLVTLKVRNASLVEVASAIQRQTWEKLQVDPKLDAKITLDVKNKPLSEVLDQVADQAGARWGRTYAVYNNDKALGKLDLVFRGTTDLDSAGWTNIAPNFAGKAFPDVPPMHPDDGAPNVILNDGSTGSGGSGIIQNNEDVQKIIDEAVKNGATVSRSDDGSTRTVIKRSGGPGGGGERMVQVVGSPTPGSAEHGMRNVTVRRSVGPGGSTTTTTDGDGRVKIVRTSSDGKVIGEDQWSAERIVLEKPLSPKLGNDIPEKATLETASQTATKVHGHVKTFYALEKPPFAVPQGMAGLGNSAMRHFSKGSTNAVSESDIRSRLEAEARQRRIDELSKSPEQQVQRARQKLEAQSGK